MTNYTTLAREIFYRFLEQRPTDRCLFLDRECGEDPILRKSVETLLRAYDNLDGFLDEPIIAWRRK